MIQSKVINGAGVGNFNMATYVPDGATGPLPAFLYIPGLGQFGTNAANLYPQGPLDFIKNGWKPSFIVSGAQPPQAWPPAATDQSFMEAALNELINGGYGIDKTKIILTGFSDGAVIIFNYIQRETDAKFIVPAAIIPMSMGIIGLGGDSKKGTDVLAGNDFRFKTIPFLGYCGKDDKGGFLEGMQRYVGQLNAAGITTASLTTYDGAHNNWPKVYDPNGAYKPFDRALSMIGISAVVIPPVTTPPVTTPKTIKSITINYIDGSSETKP